MLYCSKCGKELFDEAVMCPYCGCPTQNYNANNNAGGVMFEDKTNIWLVLVSVLFPIVGLIIGIIFMCRGMSKSGKTYMLCAAAAWLLALLAGMLLGAAAHMM